MEYKLAGEIIKEFKELAKKYNFRIRSNKDSVSLYAKNTDKIWTNWIIYNFYNNKIVIIGNTDQCNIWFCNTRPDLTPEKLIAFTSDLNKIVNKIGYTIELKTLIDPEDWQEIADIYDAYTDPRYSGNEEQEELFYKRICENYIKTMQTQILLINPENNDSILHAYILDEAINAKNDGKINIDNFKNYIQDGDEFYEYETYKNFYEEFIKDFIIADIRDLGLFNGKNNEWDFYITYSDLKRLGLEEIIDKQLDTEFSEESEDEIEEE